MKVYFSASARNMKRDIELYRSMQDVIQRLGHIITYSWIEVALHRQYDSKNSALDLQLVKETTSAIEGAELLIAEASAGSVFGVGYEVAQAIQHKKPVLILIRKDEMANSYAAGIKNDLVRVEAYVGDSYKKLITDFLQENTVNTKDLRFNFVIDRQIHNHLRWKSFKTGKTKAEVVRDLLQQDMDSGPTS